MDTTVLTVAVLDLTRECNEFVRGRGSGPLHVFALLEIHSTRVLWISE